MWTCLKAQLSHPAVSFTSGEQVLLTTISLWKAHPRTYPKGRREKTDPVLTSAVRLVFSCTHADRRQVEGNFRAGTAHRIESATPYKAALLITFGRGNHQAVEVRTRRNLQLRQGNFAPVTGRQVRRRLSEHTPPRYIQDFYPNAGWPRQVKPAVNCETQRSMFLDGCVFGFC